MANWKNKQGLSLIGVIIAVAILAGSVLFITRLLVSRSDVVEISRQTFVATNIAREGLELMRAMRDTNWFQNEEWTNELCTGEAEYLIDAERVRAEQGLLTSQDTLLYQTAKGENVHDNTQEPTPYHRVMTVDCTAVNESPAFILVTSTVSWEREARMRQVVLKEKLFNWLP